MKLLLFHLLLIQQPLVKIITNERLISPKSGIILHFNALENDIRFFLADTHKFDSIQYQLQGYETKPITSIYPEIRYTGKEFDKEADTKGNGLNNFEKRAKEGFMNFELKTEKGQGTEINLLIPEL